MPAGPAATMRRLVARYRNEGRGAARESIAIGLGAFIGCQPVFGLHLPICLFVGWLFNLNRIKLYLAANVSNPFVLPLLLFVEIQTGAWLRTGAMHSLTIETLRATSPWSFGVDLIVGAIAVGAGLGLAFGSATYAALRSSRPDERFSALVDRAADRYINASVTAWEFAHAKLRSDPVYRTALCEDLLPSGGTFLDVGCGQGLTLALLIEARRDQRAAPGCRPCVFERLVGIEARPRIARLARLALADEVEIREADAAIETLPAFSGAAVFDVLQMLQPDEQHALLTEMRRAIDQRGVILVREADPLAGWRFWLVRSGNRLKALISGSWRQPLGYRTSAEWIATFQQCGFEARLHRGSGRNPLGNVVFTLRVEGTSTLATAPHILST